jgi:hypothetical protein
MELRSDIPRGEWDVSMYDRLHYDERGSLVDRGHVDHRRLCDHDDYCKDGRGAAL